MFILSFMERKKTVESDDYNLVRDEFELALLKEALRQNKPIMAICRGVQLVNVAFGGTSIKKSKVTGKDYLSGHLTLLKQ